MFALHLSLLSSTNMPNELPVATTFASSCGNGMVLQRAPAKACVTGALGTGGTGATLTVRNTSSGASYNVTATVTASKASATAGQWKACLVPTPAGGDFVLTVRCEGCADETPANISAVTFGEVWYCGGQRCACLPACLPCCASSALCCLTCTPPAPPPALRPYPLPPAIWRCP